MFCNAAKWSTFFMVLSTSLSLFFYKKRRHIIAKAKSSVVIC